MPKILSGRLCWDAVKYFAWKSGIITSRMHRELSADKDPTLR
jgi:hypothetical protein